MKNYYWNKKKRTRNPIQDKIKYFIIYFFLSLILKQPFKVEAHLIIKPDSSSKHIKIRLPLTKLKVTSPFGNRTHPVTGSRDFHKGVDLAARSDIVFCILDGIVKKTGYNAILGNYVSIQHAGVKSIYGHLSYIYVNVGQKLLAGYPVAVTGATGRVTGEHLHFALRSTKGFLNPLNFLKQLFELNLKDK